VAALTPAGFFALAANGVVPALDGQWTTSGPSSFAVQ
jgi:hypothetical protein